MGRRRERKVHLASGQFSAETTWGRSRPIPVCGDDKFDYPESTEDEDKVTCGACRSGIFKRRLAERPADAVSLELGKFEGMSPYRFTYKALVGGEHVGFVVYDGAYGAGAWHVCSINVPDAKDRREVSFKMAADPKADHPRDASFRTKEEALIACEEMRAQGRLRTFAEEDKRMTEWRAELARRSTAYEARKVREAEDRDLAELAITEVLATLNLTNTQHAGLEAALKIVREAKKDAA
jgi:hypothetical protein